jgi:Ca2+-binding EF-hand superfamily protein
VTEKKLDEEKLDEVREAFDYNDRDEDGLIDLEEFADMLDDLEADMSEAETREGFREIDTNHDGKIDFGEFAAWWAD